MNDIIINKRDSMVEIEQELSGDLNCVILSNDNIRKLLNWLKRELPDTSREIFCADCPEYICRGYQVNESERGHKNR